MGRRAKNVVAFNDQAVRKVVKDAAKAPRGEWRIDGVPGLVLVTRGRGPEDDREGVGAFFVFFTGVGGQRRKLRLGEYHADHFPLTQARTRAWEIMAAADRGADPVAEAEAKAAEARARANAMTFRELAERCLAENPHLAATTRRNYRQYLEKHALPAIGSMPADAVTPDHIVDICKSVEAGEAYVQSQNVKTAIGGVYRWAMRQRIVKANPCAGIGRRSPKVERSRNPTSGELAALWAGIDNPKGGFSPKMKTIIRLGILTAQRRTEVAGARISELQDLDTDDPVWVIPGDVNKRGKIIEGRTKNGREQHVPLSKQAAQLFREAIARSPDNEFVFPGDVGKVKYGKAPAMPHINSGSVTSAMRRLREVAGVEDISIHDMRRAVSNWLKDQGVSREVRDLVLNHKDGSVTEAHYSSDARMEKQVRAALQAWGDHVWEVTGQAEQPDNVTPLRRVG